MKPIKAGSTSKSIDLFIQDSSSTTGAGLTGLAFNTASLTAYYRRSGAAPVAITLATLASNVAAFSSGGFVAVDGTNMPGVYRLDIPDAALAAGVDEVVIMLKGATNMAPALQKIILTAMDLQDGVRGGMTSLPNAAAEAAGGLYTRGTGAGQINQPANGRVDANTIAVSGTTQTARDLGNSLPAAAPGASGGLPTVDATNSVKVQTAVKKNTALSGFTFPMFDAANLPITGRTVTAQRSIDGGALATVAGSAVTEVSNGIYKVDLAAADLNGNGIMLRFSAAGAVDTFIALMTQT